MPMPCYTALGRGDFRDIHYPSFVRGWVSVDACKCTWAFHFTIDKLTSFILWPFNQKFYPIIFHFILFNGLQSPHHYDYFMRKIVNFLCGTASHHRVLQNWLSAKRNGIYLIIPIDLLNGIYSNKFEVVRDPTIRWSDI